MDNKNNLISNQLAAEYPYCLSDIYTWHRNNYSVFLNADVYSCCNRIIYAKRYITWHWGISIRIFVKSLWNTDGRSSCYSIPSRNQWSDKINLKNFIQMVTKGDRESYRLFLCKILREEVKRWTLTISITERRKDLTF